MARINVTTIKQNSTFKNEVHDLQNVLFYNSFNLNLIYFTIDWKF